MEFKKDQISKPEFKAVGKSVKEENKLVLAKVKLFQDHIHGGILRLAGSEILVDEASLRYIEDHNIGIRV